MNATPTGGTFLRFRLVVGVAWAALLTILGIAGCGDGTVVAKGRVLVEGAPASGGRLMLTRLGGGPHAFSLVDHEGEFSLRASTGSSGAYPGSYHVSFHQPLDAATRQQLAPELAGRIDLDELSVTYRAPRDQPLVIPDTDKEDLVIDIRSNDGWTRRLNE